MTVRGYLKATWMTAATVMLLAAIALADREMDFVDGLIAKGYYELAIEHLDSLAQNAALPAADQVLVPLKRGQAYRRLAGVTGDAEKKKQYLAEASRALDEFTGKHPSHPAVLGVSLDKAEIETDRAQALQTQLEGMDPAKDPEGRKKLLAEIEGIYQKATAAAKAVVAEAGPKAEAIKHGTSSYMNDDRFWAFYGPKIRGMLQIGNVEYLWAQAYPTDPKNTASAERKKHLDAAAGQFDLAKKERPVTNVTFDASVRRGMCLRELAPFQKDKDAREKMLKEAMREFDDALTAERTPLTKPTRAEAYYQKAVTSMEAGEYEAAASSVDGFMSESPEGPNSYRGQQALLLKARALGELADQVRKRPQVEQGDDWRDLCAQAQKTLKDVTPVYRQIREEADRLVQDWTKKFADGGEAPIVISPILTAARAKEAFEKGELPQAIELYREVVTLSQGKPQFAQFEMEAWRTLGVCYYKQLRLYEADIAWNELLKRFPEVQGANEIAWIIAGMYAYKYNQSKDAFDLERYLDGLQHFISRYPRDPRIFGALTESAKVYTIQGDLVKAADIWGQARPENERYAESMFNSGDLYRQEYLKLAEQGKGATDDAKDYATKARERLRLAADAPEPAEKPAENYRALALARLADMNGERLLPQPESARLVPPLVREFKERFPAETSLMPQVLLAGVSAHVQMNQPAEGEKLATEIVDKYATSEAFLPAVQMMVIAWQGTDPQKATAWREQLIGPESDLKQARTGTLLALANDSWRLKQHDAAVRYFRELERRFGSATAADVDALVESMGEGYRDTVAAKTGASSPSNAAIVKAAHDDIQQSLAAVWFDAGKYDDAVPYYERFLAGTRKVYEADRTSGAAKSAMLTNLRRLARCLSEKGDGEKAVKLWLEFLEETYGPPAAPEYFEGVYQLARTYVRMNRYNEARKLLLRTETVFGGFGDDETLRQQIEELKKQIKA